MEEKICTGCGKEFVGEGELCEECLAAPVEEAVVEQEVVSEAEEIIETPVAEEIVLEEEFNIPEESEFYVEYDEEEPKKGKGGAKIAAAILGTASCLYGIYYMILMIINTLQQNAMMAQYGMASQLGIADFLPYVIMAAYFICGIVGSFLPRKAAAGSLILLMFPGSWLLFNGIDLMRSLVTAVIAGQTIPTDITITYVAFFVAGILCNVAAFLHLAYLKAKND